MGIPYVLKGEVDSAAGLDIERYYRMALEHDFSDGYQRYRAGFRAFFEVTGLRCALPV